MAMITNIKHFLDAEGQIPEMSAEATQLLMFLGGIVEAASTAYDRPITSTDKKCRIVVDGVHCDGEIEAWVYAESNEVGWECCECDDAGVISNWVGTMWDRRNYIRH